MISMNYQQNCRECEKWFNGRFDIYTYNKTFWSWEMLKLLFKTYEFAEVAEMWYDGPKETQNVWIDVEAPDYGWLWVLDKNQGKDMMEILYHHARNLLRPYNKLLKHRRIYQVKSRKYGHILVIPLRDVAKKDIVITMSNGTEGIMC